MLLFCLSDLEAFQVTKNSSACMSLFCFSKKVTKKGAPQSITPRLRDGSLIKLRATVASTTVP